MPNRRLRWGRSNPALPPRGGSPTTAWRRSSVARSVIIRNRKGVVRRASAPVTSANRAAAAAAAGSRMASSDYPVAVGRHGEIGADPQERPHAQGLQGRRRP